MTDYPIPDNLRDEFAAAFWGQRFDTEIRNPIPFAVAMAQLDVYTRRGFHIELRLPEFAVHDDTCCPPGPDGDRLMWVETHDGGHWGGPCPGVGWYCWTALTEDPTPQPQSKVVDLMAALQASLENAKADTENPTS